MEDIRQPNIVRRSSGKERAMVVSFISVHGFCNPFIASLTVRSSTSAVPWGDSRTNLPFTRHQYQADAAGSAVDRRCFAFMAITSRCAHCVSRLIGRCLGNNRFQEQIRIALQRRITRVSRGEIESSRLPRMRLPDDIHIGMSGNAGARPDLLCRLEI